MSESKTITIERGWNIVLRDLSIEPQNVLRRARLSTDLLDQAPVRISVSEYFALCTSLDEEVGDPAFAIRLGTIASPETFDPPCFAALCCQDLVSALKRIGEFKRLVAPKQINIHNGPEGLVVSWQWDDPTLHPPRLLMATELVFMVHLARIGTRETIRPVRVSCPVLLDPLEHYEDFFGVTPMVSERQELVFRPEDASRPFLTASKSMWKAFEPGLRQQLTKLNVLAPLPERVRSVLLECLPSGEASIIEVSRRLGMSARTLQRQLEKCGVGYRDIVKQARLDLSQHYLSNTTLSYPEISLLVGFDDASSFFRAFREWTGMTPESARQAGEAHLS